MVAQRSQHRLFLMKHWPHVAEDSNCTQTTAGPPTPWIFFLLSLFNVVIFLCPMEIISFTHGPWLTSSFVAESAFPKSVEEPETRLWLPRGFIRLQRRPDWVDWIAKLGVSSCAQYCLLYFPPSLCLTDEALDFPVEKRLPIKECQTLGAEAFRHSFLWC